MKNLYIFFFETQFKTGSAIRMVTRYKYNHVAISFEPNTDRLYSYARYRYHEPLLSGFGVEYTDRYRNGAKPVCIKVYEVPVTDEHYERVKKRIDYYINYWEHTQYNFFDIIFYPFKHHVELQFTHTCLSFACELLDMQGIHSIEELDARLACKGGSVIFEGPLSVFEASPSSGPIDFYERRGRVRVLAQSGLAMCVLAASLIRKTLVL